MGVEKQAAVIRGVVNGFEDQRYSSTEVSGGGSHTTVTNGVAHTSTTPRYQQR